LELQTNFQAQFHFIFAREWVLNLIRMSSIYFSMTHLALQVKSKVWWQCCKKTKGNERASEKDFSLEPFGA
jgi:hypothetical protein